jgi:hypothetical protein
MRPIAMIFMAPAAWLVIDLALFVFIMDSHPLPGPLQTPGLRYLSRHYFS